MKKILGILIFISLISISNVSGGKSIFLDFNEKESYIIPMFLSDRIVFEFEGDKHSIILDEIKERRVEFDVFIYQEKNKKIKEGEDRDAPIYAFIDTVNLLKFDLNRDDTFDLELDLLDFDSKKALVEITKINEIKEDTLGSPTNVNRNNTKDSNIKNNNKFNNKWILMGVAIIVIIVLFGILIDRFTGNMKWSYH